MVKGLQRTPKGGLSGGMYMASFKALSTGAKTAVLLGGAAVAGLAAYGGYTFRQNTSAASLSAADTGVEAAPIAPVVVDPAVANSATEAAQPAETSRAIAEPAAADTQTPDPASAAPSVVVPSFDVVRVEPDGTAVVAGKAEPGATIVLRVDGAEISATTADANGNFAAFFVLESSDAARLLTMTSILPDQTELPAVSEVALAPTQQPVVVAAAEPTTAAPATPEPSQSAPTEGTPTAPPAALLITKDGVTVLQPPAQPAATDPAPALSIETISYTPTGDVQLAGRAAAGSVLRLYLDNAPLMELIADDTGLWAATMPEIAPGIYTLRADQLAEDGTVAARFETPFKRETTEALAAATRAPDPAVQTAIPDVVEPDVAVPETPAPVAPTEPKAPATQVAEAQPEPAPTDTTVTAPDSPASEVAAATPQPAAISITVQPGFTLWGIASQQFGDGVLYVQVYEANKDKIRDPDLIYPGQVFVIPAASD